MYDNNIYNMDYVAEIGSHPITVCSNIKEAKLQVTDSEGEKLLDKSFRPSYSHIYNFRDFMFHRYTKHYVRDKIFDYYYYRHLEIENSKTARKQLEKRISKNIDPTIYMTLFDYDKSSFYKTSKHQAYVEAMLLNIKREPRESNKEYKLRETSIRNKLLNDAGINLEYCLGLPHLFNGNNIFDYFKATKNALKLRKYSNVYFINKNKNKDKNKNIPPDNNADNNIYKHISFDNEYKEGAEGKEPKSNQSKIKKAIKKPILPKIPHLKFTSAKKIFNNVKKIGSTSISRISSSASDLLNNIDEQLDSTKVNIANYAKTVKGEIHQKYTAKKGLLNELHQKVKQSNFKQKVQKTLKKHALKGAFAAGIIALTIGGLNSSQSQSNPVAHNSTKKIEFETNNTQDTLKTLDSSSSSMTIQENIIEDSTEAPTVKIEKKKENKGNAIKKEDKSKTSSISDKSKESDKTNTSAESIVLQDALLNSLEIDFDSDFTMNHGKYYETPEGTGRYGNFENRKGDLNISLVNVIDENGNYHQYSINDDKTLSEIKAMYPNSTISYHVNTDSGMMLGWNSNANNIEKRLVKRTLKDMKDKGYLSTKIMQFLCDNKLSDSIDKNECSEYLNSIRSAVKQYKADKAMEVENTDNER